MKFKFLKLPLVLAASTGALTGMSGPGFAGGDWTDDGITNYNRSVPVPAPIPVPINAAQWYLRGDGGWAASASGDIDVEGFPIKTFDFSGGDQSFSFGFGIGYYLTRTLRMEVAGDWTDEQTVGRTSQYVTQTSDVAGPDHPNGGGETSIDTINFGGDFSHKATLHSTAALFNLYYDIPTGTRFTPYIGGGLGLSVHRLRVVGDTALNCIDIDRDYTPDPAVAPLDQNGMPCSAAVNPSDTATVGARDSNTITAYGLAATAMAGVSLELSPGILWDTGYRFIYRGGSAAIGYNTPSGPGKIEINDRSDHEIRTGIRFDIF